MFVVGLKEAFISGTEKKSQGKMATQTVRSTNSALGPSDLSVYVTEPLQAEIQQVFSTIDDAIQGALDKVVDDQGGIQYEPKPLNDIATLRPNTGDVNMNNKRITNLSSVPGLTIDEIIATPNVAVNVSTCSNLISANLVLNTAYCGPLFPTMNVKGKRVTNASDPELILPDDPNALEKTNQLVTVGFQNAHTLTSLPEDRNNFYARGKLIYDLEDTFVYKDSDVRTVPD